MKEFGFLDDREKRLIALFFKRMVFSHALECTDGENDKEQAYEMLDVIRKFQEELAAQGFNPR